MCSLSIEENIIPSKGGGTDDVSETAASPVCKPVKAAKAGQKAPLEAVKSWKENGFSRLTMFSGPFFGK